MKKLTVVAIILFLLTGCQNTGASDDIKPLSLADQAVIDQSQADEAKQIVLTMEEVVEIKGVNNNKNKLYLAPRVKHFDRFRLNDIRKKGYDSIKNRYPEAKIFFSTDKKIFIELEKLEEQLKNKSISEERLNKELKSLEDMMKG